MQLDTNHTRYIGTDATKGAIHVVIPRGSNLTVEHLQLDGRDPESTEAAEFKLLEQELTVTRTDL